MRIANNKPRAREDEINPAHQRRMLIHTRHHPPGGFRARVSVTRTPWARLGLAARRRLESGRRYLVATTGLLPGKTPDESGGEVRVRSRAPADLNGGV
jgi:hypothetical protein